MKGIVIELPSSLAKEIREGKSKLDEEWEQLIPLPQSRKDDGSDTKERTPSHGDDDVSLPCTMPAVKINWENLLGYIPSSDELPLEKVTEALWSSNDALDKLLTSGVARHVLSGEEPSEERFFHIDYPRFIADPEQQLISTARLWKAVLKPHEIPVVEHLLEHLRNCHRTLWWKYAMSDEIRSLAASEISYQEIQEWNRKRPRQLKELYAMRETIERVYEETCAKVEALEEERMKMAKAEYMKFSETFENNDDLLDLFPRESDDEEYDINYQDEYLGDEDEDSIRSSEDSQQSWIGSEKEEEEVPVTEHKANADSSVPVSDVPETDANETLPIPQIDINEQLTTDTLEEAFVQHDFQPPKQPKHTLEEYIVIFTTTELRMAQAASTVFEQRLERIDELLETLQDEEWAAEEGGDDEEAQQEVTDPKEFGLLDQILAMILGSTDLNPQESFREHMDIVQDWKAYFGRLPPSLNSGSKKTSVKPNTKDPAELKQTLGIVDNFETDWDSDKEEAKDLSCKAKEPSVPQKVGLRPGGRLVMP